MCIKSIFFLKAMKKNSRLSSAAVVIGALRVKDGLKSKVYPPFLR